MLKVESVAVEDLVLDPSNARKHDAKNLKAIAGSLSEFGQRKPIVVTDENVVDFWRPLFYISFAH